MSKRTRGSTREANRRRESHARKVWGKAELPKAAHWFDRRLNGKRIVELARMSMFPTEVLVLGGWWQLPRRLACSGETLS